MTALFNRDELVRRKNNLLRTGGIRTIYIKECRVLKRLKTNPEMAEFFAQQHDGGPLFPRDAFQVESIILILNARKKGGRTAPLALKCDLEQMGLEEEYEIMDFDVVSLYPSVNFKASYPIGKLI